MPPIRVVILGSTGMLGYAVSQYFNHAIVNDVFETHISYRNAALAHGKNSFYFDALNSRLDSIPASDYVINCIGCVKQKNHSIDEYVHTNAVFPHKLAAHCKKVGSKLIHVTTDCVFSGRKGKYSEHDIPDCTDVYGISKVLGEAPECMLLRTSIVGEELRENYSLLEWAKSQAGKTIQGYTNHIWNGVTSKQYAKICKQIMLKNLYSEGLHHVFAKDAVSKGNLLSLFNTRFQLNLNIVDYSNPTQIDRSLTTTKELNSVLEIPSIEDMIRDL